MQMFSKYILNLILIVAAVFIQTRTIYAQDQQPFDLIIDSDVAIDDWSAILYILNQKEASNLLGFTIAGSGEAHCEPALKNIADLVYLAGRENEHIPITCGDSVPMDGFHTFPDDWRLDADTLSGIQIPHNPIPFILPDHSVEWLHTTLMNNPRPVVILTIGPLTNMGQLLQKYPEVAPKIQNIFIMGGAVNVEGNLIVPPFTTTFQNMFAEWNLWVDPLAAKIVFNSSVPLTIIPLDATNQVQVTREFAARFKDSVRSPSAKFYADILDKNLWFIDSGEYYFWDVLAASSMYNNLCTFEKQKLDIVVNIDPNANGLEQIQNFGSHFLTAFDQFANHMNRNAFEQIETGRTIAVDTPNENKIHNVCVKANAEMFTEDFIEVINRQ